MHGADRASIDRIRAVASVDVLFAQRMTWKHEALAIFLWLMLEPAAGPATPHRPAFPVLILHGDLDKLVDVQSARGMAEAYAPRSTLVVLKGIGHSILKPRHTELAAAIGAWVTREVG